VINLEAFFIITYSYRFFFLFAFDILKLNKGTEYFSRLGDFRAHGEVRKNEDQ
jgi:hypothetical protein